jgi:hypothetical protein
MPSTMGQQANNKAKKRDDGTTYVIFPNLK